jgi:hypothetical protein
VNLTEFKIIDPRPHDDGDDFPFERSTDLYPEWNIAALQHVPEDVSRHVQEAMLALADHAAVGLKVRDCVAANDEAYCDSLDFPHSFVQDARCDTTAVVAEKAVQAMEDGKYSSWTTTLSYMQLRTMQEATGFIQLVKETNTWRCSRSEEIYDAIACPADYVKKSPADVKNGCAAQGLKCDEGFQCICQPCYLPVECIDSVDMLGRCVEYSVLLPAILVPVALISFAACLGMVSYKSAQMVKQAKKAAQDEREFNDFVA